MGNFSTDKKSLKAMLDTHPGTQIFDVRKPQAFRESDHMLPAARWRDPASVAQWAGALQPDSAVVVYCVHGHEVSQGVAADLRNLGFDAHYLEGGFEGWRDAGYLLVGKPAGAGDDN